VTRPGRRRRADSRYAEQAGRLAEWLRDRRMQAGMSQEQLASRAQVAVATVRKIEKGVVIEPGYFTVLALMHALGTTSEDPAVLGRRASIVANFLEARSGPSMRSSWPTIEGSSPGPHRRIMRGLA
jgi:transcriptional regulator with XRE-family HTH domain